MIEKERLEELIRQGATVWSLTFESEITLNEKCYVYLDANCDYRLFAFDAFGCQAITYLEDLEEDVETVKFKCKYQNITRTETLSLPTWEEFEQKSYFDFIASDGRNIIIEQTLLVDFAEEDCLSDFNLVVSDWNGYSHKALFRGDYTKESYTKACELCRKLFLGEEV